MPYIKESDRNRLDEHIQSLAQEVDTEGELNYAITRLVHLWLGQAEINYAALNAAVGVLSCAKTEIERRLVAPYEDKKILAHGDLPAVVEQGEGE